MSLNVRGILSQTDEHEIRVPNKTPFPTPRDIQISKILT